MTPDTPATMAPYPSAPAVWHTGPTQFHAAPTQAGEREPLPPIPVRTLRPTLTPRGCGCDWDTRVFGHTYCWTIRFPNNHITCRCTICPCDCHQQDR